MKVELDLSGWIYTQKKISLRARYSEDQIKTLIEYDKNKLIKEGFSIDDTREKAKKIIEMEALLNVEDQIYLCGTFFKVQSRTYYAETDVYRLFLLEKQYI